MSFRDQCATIATAMRAGGYYDRIMRGGPELDRVKAYLEMFASASPPQSAIPMQQPDYPLFPGLRNLPFHDDASAFPGVALLERNVDMIQSEWRALADQDYLQFAPSVMHNQWQVYLFHYMGVEMAPFYDACAGTRRLLRELPRVCLDYPWGDALLSVHAAKSHLAAHCSVDNLRVRCHLGLRVPAGCRIRVAQETRNWQEGRALLFEDSFEHEVWNEGDERRAILIVDFWHPDLTAIEIEALTAGFSRAAVREQFMYARLQMAQSPPPALAEHLREQVLLQENLPARQRYW